jgi:L-threonylcarbamoyladenylate synthase
VIGPFELPAGVDDGVQRPSPGMSRRHYAPRARLVLVDEIDDLQGYEQPVGVLTHEGLNAREYAADLYAALHRLDDSGVATIVALAPPATEEWLAVRDRLSRAAAK